MVDEQTLKEALTVLIANAQEGCLMSLMLLYSTTGKQLAEAVGLSHRWVLDMALED